MKFSIVSSSGLSHNLGGIVGQSLIPHDYHIDESGNIQLQGKRAKMIHFYFNGHVNHNRRDSLGDRIIILNSDRVIASNMTRWSPEDECFKISDIAATKFMGHSTREFILETPFAKFYPSWMEVQLHEDVGPK